MKHSCRHYILIKTILILFCLSIPMTQGISSGTSNHGQIHSGNARLIEALRDFIPHLLRLNGTPGMNIALARTGKIIWEEGFGYADLDKKIPMTPETVFHSGSMGKTYTATAIMQLVERGIIGLYEPINKYLKKLQIVNPLGEREITFYDLLTHRSGLTVNNAGCHFVLPKPLEQHIIDGYSQKMFKIYEGTALPRWSAKVGEKYQYSNFGMATLGYLVQVTNPEGLTFSDYVQKHIIDPLGMTSTQYPPVQDSVHVRSEIFKRFSKGYAKFGPIDLPTPTIYFADFPAGTVVSTPGDHIRILLAYLNGGSYNGYQLLKPETVKHMLTPQLGVGSKSLGLVWALSNIDKPDYYFSHAGAHMFGWNNDYRAYPKQDFAFAVASNNWDMTSGSFSRHESEPIAEFISTWIERENAGAHKVQLPNKSWAWKCSYVIGLIIVERLKGGLGIDEPLTQEMVDTMANGVKVRSHDEKGIAVWDPEGFHQGAKDMMSVKMTREAIAAFLKTDRLKVAYEELNLIYREIGGQQSLLPWIGYD